MTLGRLSLRLALAALLAMGLAGLLSCVPGGG